MFFALSLLFVFIILGLLIYRGELFHISSDDDFSYDEFNMYENQAKNSSSLPENIKNSPSEHLLEKTK